MKNRKPLSKPSNPVAVKVQPDKAAVAKLDARTSNPVERTNDSVIKLIRQIKAGTLRGRMLAPPDRQRCVEHLTWEGVSAPEIAEILGLSERTVNRDRAQVRSDNAISRNPALAGELAGVIMQQSERAAATLRRLGKDPATPASVRVETERIAFEMRRQAIQTLQSLGYLPTAAQEFRGEFYGDMGIELPKFNELAAEITQLAAAAKKQGSKDPATLEELKKLGEAAQCLSIQHRAEQLKRQIDKGE